MTGGDEPVPGSAPLLEVRGLTRSFRSSQRFGRPRTMRAVDGVSFSVRKGRTFGLVGESGSGKSTIGRLLVRLLEADGGSITFDGVELANLAPAQLRSMRRRIQIIFQDPYGSLDPRVRVGKAIAEPIALHRLRPASGIADRVTELLALVGLPPEAAGRYPHQFSGGQRQRIAIARALAVEPDLIVCDEPVSALDVSVQAQVVNLLADLRERLGVAYVFISHDMAVVRHLSDDLGVLYAGRLVEQGPAARVLGDPRHPYTRMLLAASPSPVPIEKPQDRAIVGEPPDPFDPEPGCRFASRCAHADERCRANEPAADAFRDADHVAACIRSAELPAMAPRSDDESLMSDAYRRRMALLRAARAGVSA